MLFYNKNLVDNIFDLNKDNEKNYSLKFIDYDFLIKNFNSLVPINEGPSLMPQQKPKPDLPPVTKKDQNQEKKEKSLNTKT